MSERQDDGGAAFPRVTELVVGNHGLNMAGVPLGYVAVSADGMSLRDWFAGQALAGLCANPGGPYQYSATGGWSLTNCDHGDVAAEARRLADAMLLARSPSTGSGT